MNFVKQSWQWNIRWFAPNQSPSLTRRAIQLALLFCCPTLRVCRCCRFDNFCKFIINKVYTFHTIFFIRKLFFLSSMNVFVLSVRFDCRNENLFRENVFHYSVKFNVHFGWAGISIRANKSFSVYFVFMDIVQGELAKGIKIYIKLFCWWPNSILKNSIREQEREREKFQSTNCFYSFSIWFRLSWIGLEWNGLDWCRLCHRVLWSTSNCGISVILFKPPSILLHTKKKKERNISTQQRKILNTLFNVVKTSCR